MSFQMVSALAGILIVGLPLAGGEVLPQDRVSLIATGDAEVKQGHFDAALVALEKAANLSDKERQPVDWAETQSKIAFVFLVKGDRTKPLGLAKEVLSIYEKHLDPLDPKLSSALSFLGEVYQLNQSAEEAAPLYRRALAIDEKLFGENDPRLIDDLSRLSLLLGGHGQYSEAETAYRRLLAIEEKSYGHNDPKLCHTLDGLSAMLKVTNKLGEALPFYRRSVLLKEKEEFTRTRRPVSVTFYAQFYVEALQSLGWTPEHIASELAAVEKESESM